MVDAIEQISDRLGRRLAKTRSPRIAGLVARGTRVLSASTRPRAGKVVTALTWRRPHEAVLVDVVYRGLRLPLDLRDNLQRALFYRGSYEAALHDLIAAELRPGDQVFDIGANIGIHSLPLARALDTIGGEVWAFEAAPDTAAALERARQANAIRSLHVIPLALGAAPGSGTLKASATWGAADTSVRSLHGTGEDVDEVEIVRFDDWMVDGPGRMDVVKVDVEGSERDVLAGMGASLRRHRPRLLVVEVEDTLMRRAGTSAVELASLVADLGYEADGPSILALAAGPTGRYWPNAVLRPA